MPSRVPARFAGPSFTEVVSLARKPWVRRPVALRFVTCLLIALALNTASAASAETVRPAADPLIPRVRAVTPKMQKLIAEGVRRSNTFRHLIEAVDKSDLVVYLEATNKLPVGLDGRLTFLTSAGGVRYLHVQITSSLGLAELIAIAGHELQHALEVAAHPEVRDGAALAKLYERIGIPGIVKDRYDTNAAQSTGKRVRAELG